MADNHFNYIVSREFSDCFEECSRLIDTQNLKIGDRFDWPVKYEAAWNSTSISDALTVLMSSCGLTHTPNGSGIIIIAL